MRLEMRRRSWRLLEPLPAAHGTVERRELLEVRLVDEDGLVGRGEAAPLESYDGVSIDAVRGQIEACREVLADAGRTRRERLDACREHCPAPQALAAIDVALWETEARRAGSPVARLLAGEVSSSVEANATIGAVSPGAAGVAAGRAAASGFRCVKVKVGIGDDGERVAAVRRAAGRGVAIRLDANGAWTVEEAVERLRGYALRGVELCEEPVRGVDDLRTVRAALGGRPPIAMDETATQPGAVGSGAADAVCLKVAGCGGITGVMEAAAAARAAGSDVYLASTLDGPVGIAAALHCAAALRVQRPCGLATLPLFADSPDPFPIHLGRIDLPCGPGLGAF